MSGVPFGETHHSETTSPAPIFQKTGGEVYKKVAQQSQRKRNSPFVLSTPEKCPPGIKKARKFRALQNVLTHTSYERGANLLFDLADRAFERDGEFLHDKPNAGVKKTPLAEAQILDVFEMIQLAHDVGDILQTAGRKLVVENALTLRP